MREAITDCSDGRWMFSQRIGGSRFTLTKGTRAELLRAVTDEKAKLGGTLQPPSDLTVAALMKLYLELGGTRRTLPRSVGRRTGS